MAKWGEGDPRWIVEERPDATNPNNWHWIEKNAGPWSLTRLKELLLKQTLEKGPVKIEFKEFSKLEGEATANNRKAKLIFFFEWTIIIDFEATISDSEIVYKGKIEILNLSDENEPNEIQISAQVNQTGPHERQIMDIINNDGLSLIRGQLEKYIQELKTEFSQGLILPNDKGVIRPQAVATGKTIIVDKREFQNTVCENNEQSLDTSNSKQEKVKFASFELSSNFKTSPDHLFEILTNNQLVSVWCPNSSLDLSEGGSFSMLGGLITGKFGIIIKDKQISMKWCLTKNYPTHLYADIQLYLMDKGDYVILQVKAEGVPEDSVDKTKECIDHYYFKAIGHRFGIALTLF